MPFRSYYKIVISASIALFLCFNNIFAQVDKEFWFAIPKETRNHGSITTANNVSFKITNQSNVLTAHVEISMPANSGFTTRVIDIPPSQSYIEVMATNWNQFDDIYANPSDSATMASPGYTNHGIYIKSNNDITVYYDYDNYYNRDLFSLKGKNALGTEFYVPLQNIWINGAGYTPDLPLSSAIIVATEDATTVTVYPSTTVRGPTTTSAPFTITLNKGQTYSVVANGQSPANHFSGTRIVSDKPIAVTMNDDSDKVGGASNTCYDITGDQLVPTSIIGTKYLVMTGNASVTYSSAAVQEPQRGEQIIINGTQAGTVINFYKKDGSLLYGPVSVGAGGVTYVSPDITDPNQTVIYISATKPIYVFHITGIGCEMGGAILPPITNCTGSNEVSFYRSSIASNGSSSMTLNLMIPYDKTIPFSAATQSHNFFYIHYQNGTTQHIDTSWFEPVDSAGWAVLKPAYRGNAGIGTLIPINQAVKITNDKDFFHLGITNGYSGQTNKYGYFSSFNATLASALVASVNEVSHISCFGDTVFLKAGGGLEYTWHYGSPSGPPTYLSNSKSSTPQVFCPPGFHDFYVVVHQAKCFGDDTLKVSVRVLPEVKAYFETDTTAGCAPFKSHFTNKSTGATKYEWSYRKDNDPPIVFIPPVQTYFTQPTVGNFDNSTSPYKPIIYTYKLKASYFGECPDTLSKQIIVYPVINANFLPKDTVSCNPVVTRFRNLSSGNVADTLYQWNFGDGNSSPSKNPVHVFENLFRAIDTVYNVRLVATSPYYCRDTARATVTVHPFIKAGFTVDTVRGCSPLTIKIYNTSLNKQGINQYTWDFGDGIIRTVSNDTLYHTYPANTTASSKSYKLLLTVKNNSTGGCPDTISKQITVYPQSAISFIANPGTSSICDSTLVSFTSLPSPAISSYLWDFGDGNTSTDPNPKHLFTNNTTVDKTLTVKLVGMSTTYCNGYASTNITVHPFLDPQFAIDVPSFCAPYGAPIKNKSRGGIVKYDWYYGDGGHDNHTGDTTHLYRNTTNVVFAPLIKLVLTNSGGCKDSLSQRLTIYPEIKARFTPSSTMGCNPLTVKFTNQSTYLNQVSKYYKWQFGDSTSSTDLNPTHVFTNTASTSATYHVKLRVESEYNCSDDTIVDINVLPYIEAKFAVDSVNGCSPFPVQIANSSRGNITQYQWIYGDGVVDGHISPLYTHTYINNTTNNPVGTPLQRYLKLIASNSGGICQSRDSILLTIYPEVISKFTTNVTEGCNPLNIRYTNQSGPGNVPVEYNWEFGDGGTSSTKNTDHTFENLSSVEKTFKTKLYAYSVYKCADTSTVDIKVYPFINADFTFDKSIGCSPHTITINNSSSPGANGFQWIFGDGQVSASSAPIFNHIYRNLGTSTQTFYPKLIVSYNGNCQDTAIQSLQVFPEVTASFKQDTLYGCHPLEINYTNTSRNATKFSWQFGDNATSIISNPKHTYTNYSNSDSVYNVTLTASSIYNCTNKITKQVTIYPKPKALFDVPNSINCPPFLVSIQNLSEAGDFYNWTFGDGDSYVSTGLEPVSHTYDNYTPDIATYTLDLQVQSVHNCSDRISQNINVYPRVIADFTPDTSGCSALLVPFKNNTLRAFTYKWDFGDNVTSNVKIPTHKFFNNSINDTTFNVQMIGFSKFGCSDTAYRQITVHPQPIADFSALPTHLYYPDATVTIDNQTNKGIWNYNWNFGDGQTASVDEPSSHEYLHWGIYYIRLRAWNTYCSDSVTQRISIIAPKPIADFDMTASGCVPLTVSFTDHSTWANSYKWEFDDGSVSTERYPTHVYQEPGKYQVKLTVTADGGEDYTYRTIEVYPKPTVEFVVAPSYVMLPNASVKGYNTSKLGDRYLWNFGDGDTSNLFEPTHTYKELGVYDVTLSVWTEHQCFDSATLRRAVTVEGTGVLNFPNAFKPNSNGPNGGKYKYPDTENYVFHPFHDGVVEYKLEIYDRWGELLFESNDVNIGWDGYYKGNLCKSDVYIWKAKGKFTNGSSFNKAGDVTLLR